MAARHELREDGPGRVQAVGSLLPDHRAGAVDHLGRDLLAAMGRQAVHEPRVGTGGVHQRGVDRVAAERGAARRGLVLLAHRRPHVGVHRVGSPHGLVRVGRHLDGAPEVASPLDEVVVELVAGW